MADRKNQIVDVVPETCKFSQFILLFCSSWWYEAMERLYKDLDVNE